MEIKFSRGFYTDSGYEGPHHRLFDTFNDVLKLKVAKESYLFLKFY
jgi:hypothetical protein